MADIAKFDRMMADLQRRGVRKQQLIKLRMMWLTLPEADPCPLCLLKGRHSRLDPTNETNKVECRDCGYVIVLTA